jgi:uncharacterized protein
MHADVLSALIPKVRMHCFLTGQTEFIFSFHGGEPLLSGTKLLDDFMHEVEAAFVPDIVPKFVMQTNGILIDDDWCELFAKYKMKVGISLDGPKEVNDKNRLTFNGKSTYDQVIAGIKAIQGSESCQNVGIYPGLLTVIDVESDPSQIYDLAKELGLHSFSPVLPSANYESPPSGLADLKLSSWLIKLFDLWFNDASKQKPRISFFKDIMRLLVGINATNEYVGPDNLGLLVLETNGELEPSDELKICGENFTKTGLNIVANEFTDLLQNDLVMAYYKSKNTLCGQCTKCAIKEICGGGFLPHRFSKENGFDNPTVYCRDMARLIVHIQNSIFENLPTDFTSSEKFVKLQLEQVFESWEMKTNK